VEGVVKRLEETEAADLRRVIETSEYIQPFCT